MRSWRAFRVPCCLLLRAGVRLGWVQPPARVSNVGLLPTSGVQPRAHGSSPRGGADEGGIGRSGCPLISCQIHARQRRALHLLLFLPPSSGSYGALKSLGEKKSAFNEYVQQRKKEAAEEARQRRMQVGSKPSRCMAPRRAPCCGAACRLHADLLSPSRC